MNIFNNLYEFINLAQKNRKYPNNTAQGKRAALKLFETVLHPDELESLDLVEERMKEIYLSLISKYKDMFSIQSLNTYKGRLLKTIQDYKKYGTKLEAFTHWETKIRKQKNNDIFLHNKKDTHISNSSLSIHRGVHKIQITLEDGTVCAIELPTKLTKKDASIVTKIIDTFTD